MQIEEFFKLHKSVAVAFSGGVDSAVLLLFAKRYADRVKAYYVRSQFQPQFEGEDAVRIAEMLDAEMQVIPADVLSDENIIKNPSERCYYCKKCIFETITQAAGNDGIDTVIEGTNATDDIGDRPGYRALREMGILSPLKDCGYTKKMIREIAGVNKLPVADKPSYACLATRIPTGTAITKQLLLKTEAAENLLLKEGFKVFRVRYLDGAAKLELGKKEFEILSKNREKIFELLNKYYDGVYVDLKERADE